MTIPAKLNLFFQSPTIEPASAGVPDTSVSPLLGTCKRYSTLYLLRRDVTRCLTSNTPIYWPGIMAMLAGIDLMAKLYRGAATGKISIRFEDFVNQHMNDGDGAMLWQLRNALMHSYGVYFEETATAAAPGGMGTPGIVSKRFRLKANNAPAPATLAGGTLFNTAGLIVEIDVQALTTAFASSVANYETYIRATTAEQATKFEPMFDKYGWLFIHEHTEMVGGNIISHGASGG